MEGIVLLRHAVLVTYVLIETLIETVFVGVPSSATIGPPMTYGHLLAICWPFLLMTLRNDGFFIYCASKKQTTIRPNTGPTEYHRLTVTHMQTPVNVVEPQESL